MFPDMTDFLKSVISNLKITKSNRDDTFEHCLKTDLLSDTECSQYLSGELFLFLTLTTKTLRSLSSTQNLFTSKY